MPYDEDDLRPLDELEREYAQTFEDLDRELRRLLRTGPLQAGASWRLTEQLRLGTDAIAETSRTLLGDYGESGLVSELVDACRVAGQSLGEEVLRASGEGDPHPGPRRRHSAETALLGQALRETARAHLQEVTNRYRDDCERLRRAGMLGNPIDDVDAALGRLPARRRDEDSEESFGIALIPDLRVHEKEIVKHAYEDELLADRVDLVMVVGPPAKCGTCQTALKQSVYSLTGLHPTHPPLAEVTQFSNPPLWHFGCPHFAVPYVDGQGLEEPRVYGLVREWVRELKLEWLFAPIPVRRAKSRREATEAESSTH